MFESLIMGIICNDFSDPRNFERVQHGGRQMDDPTKATQQLSLGNKFSALQD